MGGLDVLAIVGPTAVGKSAAAEMVAERLGGEVVSADSMQVYRGMDIGTAKTPPAERTVPYHLVDIVEPGARYSAAVYQQDARRVVAQLRERGRLPVFVGGTGLYIRAALDEMTFPAGESGSPVRQELEARAAELGPDALYAELCRLDPDSAVLVHPHNVKRVVRALEMHANGVSYAGQASRFAARRFHYPRTLLVGLTMDRGELYRRIEERVDGMLQEGLLDEVAGLLERGLREALTSSQAIGYKELVPVIEGVVSLGYARDAIAQATRRYAKRQMSWFRADPRVHWVDTTRLTSAEAAERILDLVESCFDERAGGPDAT